MAGRSYVIRLVSGLRPQEPVPGLDVAGTIVAAGADATGFAVGEDVFGIGQRSFARYARRQNKLAANRPAPFGQAAEHQARLLSPARYQRPGEVIRLHMESARLASITTTGRDDTR